MKELLKAMLNSARHGQPLSPELVEQAEAEITRLTVEDKAAAEKKDRYVKQLFASLSARYTHLYKAGPSDLIVATCGPRVPGTVQHCLIYGFGSCGREWTPKGIKESTNDFREYASR